MKDPDAPSPFREKPKCAVTSYATGEHCPEPVTHTLVDTLSRREFKVCARCYESVTASIKTPTVSARFSVIT